MGGRPVIYGSLEEKKHFSNEILWRFEEYAPNVKDFSWLREWRLKAKRIDLDFDNFFVITNLESELDENMFNKQESDDFEFDGCTSEGIYTGTVNGIQNRRFKGISFESLLKLDSAEKKQISDLLKTQKKEDFIKIGLGGF